MGSGVGTSARRTASGGPYRSCNAASIDPSCGVVDRGHEWFAVIERLARSPGKPASSPGRVGLAPPRIRRMPGWATRAVVPSVRLGTCDRRTHRSASVLSAWRFRSAMRVQRRLLTWGVFLVAIGGVLVANDLGAIDTEDLSDVLKLWPLALVAIGLSLVFRRTRVSLPVVLVAAALPGLVVGAAFAVGPNWAGTCDGRGEPISTATRNGRFDGPAAVTVRTGCGSLMLRTSAGDAWRYDASASAAGGGPTSLSATGRTLAIDSDSSEHWMAFGGGREDATLTLPTTRIDALALAVVAGRVDGDLSGADLARLSLTVNLGDVVVDATGASVNEVSANVNLGEVALTLPSGHDLTGSIHVTGGHLRLCVPDSLDVRVTETGTAESFTVGGVRQSGGSWQSLPLRLAPNHAELTVHVTLGALDINPIG